METNGKSKKKVFLITEAQVLAVEEYLLSVPTGGRPGRDLVTLLGGLRSLPALPENMTLSDAPPVSTSPQDAPSKATDSTRKE